MNVSPVCADLAVDKMTLDQLPVGSFGQITAIAADKELMQRLAALGLRETCTVQVLRHASLGGPVHVRVGTTEVIMRRTEARRITLMALNDLATSLP